MSIQITNEAESIKVIRNGKSTFIEKGGGINIEINGTILRIGATQGKSYNLPYSEITVPTSTDINDLASQIENFLAPPSSELATGAATSAKQDTGNASLSTIAGKDFSTEVTLALIKAKTDNLDILSSKAQKNYFTEIIMGNVQIGRASCRERV